MGLTGIPVKRWAAGGVAALALALAGGLAGFPATARTASHSEATARLSAATRATLVEQAKLVAGDASSVAQQGYSVALSADGSTALVGGPYDGGGAGAAWVFIRTGGNWTERARLVASDAIGAAQQGSSVALSADGNTALVGGRYDDNHIGAAWVFTRTGTAWTEQAKLVGSGAIGEAAQGYGVALSADGSTALVGGVYDDNLMGAAWVFTHTGSTWTQQAKLVGSGATSPALQGLSVALSANGNTALVGGPFANSYAGAAWVFTRTGSAWTQQDKLVGTGAIGDAAQGYSVALSAGGNTALVGGPYDDGQAGAAWAFTRSGSAWTQQDKLVSSDAIGHAGQGKSVALSANGNTTLVGGPYDDNLEGAAWVFTRTGSTWTEQEKLVGNNSIGHAAQGFSVALSAGGDTALVGDLFDDNHRGATWVFAPPAPGTPHPTGGSADLQVTKQAAPSDAAAGQTVEFTLTAFNRGPDDAQSATLTDSLPAGLALQKFEAGPGASCTVSAQRLECDLGTVGPGAGEIVVVHAVVQASASGSLTNSAELFSLTHDPDPTNNTASATVTVRSGSPPPSDSDLDVTKRADKATAHVGEPVTFTITVHNRGQGPSGPLLLSDLLSGPHRILEARSASGTCSGSHPLVCHLHPLAAGRSATVRVTVLPLREGTLLNEAAAIGDLASKGKVGVNLAVREVQILARRRAPHVTG